MTSPEGATMWLPGRNKTSVTSSRESAPLDEATWVRHERLLYVHGQALSMIQFEARLVLDRTTAYLVATAFLLAAFGTSYPNNKPLPFAIAVVGLVLSVVHPFVIARTIRALEFWRSSAALVESDEDFWFPGKIDDPWFPVKLGDESGRSDRDLDLIVARQRRNLGIHPRQLSLDMKMARPPNWIMNRRSRISDPNTVFSTWVPLLIAGVWIVAIGTVITAGKPTVTLLPNSPSTTSMPVTSTPSVPIVATTPSPAGPTGSTLPSAKPSR